MESKKKIILYRNCFYNASIENGRYLIKNSKNKNVDITEKKFTEVPEGMSIVVFSLLYHSGKFKSLKELKWDNTIKQ